MDAEGGGRLGARSFTRQVPSPRQVEVDPTRRFIRYDQVLGRGATKRVYKAFDQAEGIEVAWNKVELSSYDMEPEQKERMFAEIVVLKQLKHKNIMSFCHGWYDSRSHTINFITEYFTSGTLRQYRKKLRHCMPEQVVKRWAWQVLEGLVYLHGHQPAIIHRDLKCDNIFVNGTSGQVKIGDLGLATCQKGLSIVGTPEFMAPEIYKELYDEKVDIWSFGMCLLELATLEYPYAECRGPIQISRKVTMGLPPDGLVKVSNAELQQFIRCCLCPDPEGRPAARQLLKHPFFDSIRDPSPCGTPCAAAAAAAAGAAAQPPHEQDITCSAPGIAACSCDDLGGDSGRAAPCDHLFTEPPVLRTPSQLLLASSAAAAAADGLTMAGEAPTAAMPFWPGSSSMQGCEGVASHYLELTDNDSSDDEEVLIPMAALTNMNLDEFKWMDEAPVEQGEPGAGSTGRRRRGSVEEVMAGARGRMPLVVIRRKLMDGVCLPSTLRVLCRLEGPGHQALHKMHSL